MAQLERVLGVESHGFPVRRLVTHRLKCAAAQWQSNVDCAAPKFGRFYWESRKRRARRQTRGVPPSGSIVAQRMTRTNKMSQARIGEFVGFY